MSFFLHPLRLLLIISGLLAGLVQIPATHASGSTKSANTPSSKIDPELRSALKMLSQMLTVLQTGLMHRSGWLICLQGCNAISKIRKSVWNF